MTEPSPNNPPRRLCYAHHRADCDGPLSKEHYISQGILKIGQPDINNVELAGQLPFLGPANTKKLASAKILCKKHNEELSDLDAEAINICRSIFDWNQNGGSVSVTVDGDKLALWYLKAFLGRIWADKKTQELHKRLDFEGLVDALFDGNLEPNVGLSISNAPQSPPRQILGDRGIPPWAFSIMNDPFGNQQGFRSWFYPLDFELDLLGMPSFSQTRRFKPSSIHCVSRSRGSELRIEFSWSKFSGGHVVYGLG